MVRMGMRMVIAVIVSVVSSAADKHGRRWFNDIAIVEEWWWYGKR